MKLKLLLSSLLIATAIPSVTLAAGAQRINVFLPLQTGTPDAQLASNKTVSIWAQCKAEGNFNVLRIYGATTSSETGTVMNGIDQFTGIDGDFLPPTDPALTVPDPLLAPNAELLVQSAPLGGTNWGSNDPFFGFIIDTNSPLVPPATPEPQLKPNGLMITSGSAALGIAPEGCYVSMTIEPLTAFKTITPKKPKK